MDRFKRKLLEQLRHISASCAIFDAGDESEAVRIAVALRILFHDAGQSVSIFKHLGWKNSSTMFSSLGANFPLGAHTAFLRIAVDLNAVHPVRAIPLLSELGWKLTSVDDWWSEVVYEENGSTYSRKRFILGASDKDGGAHVDRTVEPFYSNLENGLKMFSISPQNLVYTGGPAPFDQTKDQYAQNAHLAILRQFGHEVLASARHFKWEL